jgi:hypothetical protein
MQRDGGGNLRRLVILLLLLFATAKVGWAGRKDATREKPADDYKGRWVVALREGMAVGFPDASNLFAYAEVFVSGDGAQVCPLDEKGETVCRNVITQPLHKGEVLYVGRVFISRKKSIFGLSVRTVSPHSIQRAIGAFAHEPLEPGEVTISFTVPDPDDYTAAVRQVARWFKVFGTAEDAEKFGNTAGGVFVREVKLGMTFAEVEQELRLPQTRVDLGQKVIYKYKDMTAEFQGGKVTDVR